MIINKTNLAAAFTGFKTVFQQAFDAAPSLYGRVAIQVASTTRQETYGWLGRTTAFREWLGDRVIQGLKTHDYSIKNKAFENTVAVDRDDLEDDTYGVYSPLVAQLGYDAKVHPDLLVFGLLEAGFATPCYDGQYFFDTDHPVAGASVSNYQDGVAAAWYLLDTRRALKPLIFQKRKDYKFVSLVNETDENVFMRKEYLYGVDARVNVGYGLWQLAYASKAALDATNYAAARAAMMSFKGDNGVALGVRPDLLLVPPSLEKAALEVVQAERLASGATNVMRGTTEALVCPYLS